MPNKAKGTRGSGEQRNETHFRNARPKAAPWRLGAGGGLEMLITPAGNKRWIFRYRVDGKESAVALGLYPALSLEAARQKRDHLRAGMAAGQTPADQIRAAQQQAEIERDNTFRRWADEHVDLHAPTWAPSHTSKIRMLLARDILPLIGDRPIRALVPADVLDVTRRIAKRGAIETAHRARILMSQVFRRAISAGAADRNVADDVRGLLPPKVRGHLAAQIDEAGLRAVLRAMASYKGTPSVMAALALAPMLMARPGELRQMRWSELDLAAATWTFTLSKTKESHVCPLPRQAVAILKDIRPLTGAGEWVFPGARATGRPITDVALTAALRRLEIPGDEQTIHGFRATARTILAERFDYPEHLLEHQLGHRVRDALGRAYNRTKYIDQRREMLQHWADYLEGLMTDGRVVPIRAAGGA